jgi:N-acetylmuramoyl-L-alanine amidase
VTAAGLTSTQAQGMRLPILRQTRMPAVLCSLAPPTAVVHATAELAEALAGAVANWIADPAADPL